MWKVRRAWGRVWRLTAVLLTYLLLIAPEWPAFGDEAYQLQALVGRRQFDFLVWELQAVGSKAEGILAGGHRYLDDDARRQVVLDYLTLLSDAQQTAAQIDALYVDPDVSDPNIASQDLQTALAQTRADLAELQPLAESIVQAQVGEVLAAEGFRALGRPWPPVLMHMTPLPSLLVVSPRDRIERVYAISLVHGLTTPEKEALETAVRENLNLSALVVPIGGMGTYPAMIMETTDLNWLFEVTAHEWSHHWMSFFPIGWNYGVDPQVRVINETVASIIDREIGGLVVAQYYPELAPPPTTAPVIVPETEPEPNAPPPFDFRAEMAETRIQVDALLADGRIDDAEAYMEQRRLYFVSNGYAIRKLNQAYFAFYGAYAAEPGGATGSDPIGPAIRTVRALSATPHDFMRNMAGVGSFAELETLVRALEGERE